jgi:hypothetical protein
VAIIIKLIIYNEIIAFEQNTGDRKIVKGHTVKTWIKMFTFIPPKHSVADFFGVHREEALQFTSTRSLRGRKSREMV